VISRKAFIAASSIMGWDVADLYRKALTALVPSALIVPAGVMAICDAQQAGYAYLQATL
jgi:intracellular sulfur oxidation DsrE/DsrF family protein